MKFHFDEHKADKVKRFLETYCIQSKSSWGGRPLTLLPWQWNDLVKPLYGNVDEQGLRQYRQASVWIPRRNGKTTVVAGLGLYHLVADGEQGAEVYILANTIPQASNCFDAACNMVLQSPQLNQRVKVRQSRRTILYPKTRSKLLVLSSECNALVGVNASALIFDEIGFYRKRELYTNLRGSMLNRKQPIIITISTASDYLEGIGKEQYDYACSVRDKVFEDSTFLPVVYAANEDEDWTSSKTWAKANPSLGFTINEKDLELLCKEAQNEQRKECEFRQFHLNQWITVKRQQWINAILWKENGKRFNPDILQGRDCYAGLDLARRYDLASYVLLFHIDGVFYLLPRFFIPRDMAKKKQDIDKVPYLHWAKNKYVTLTDGDVIDYSYIRHALNEDAKLYNIQEIGYDPYGAEHLCNQQLYLEDGHQVCEIKQTFQQLGEATATFERLLREHKLRHGDNPVLNWQSRNVVARHDPSDKIMVDKKNSGARIDGIAASIMALQRYLASERFDPGISIL